MLRVRSVLTAKFEGSGSWAMRFPSYSHIKFGAVLEGSFWMRFEGSSAPIKFECGDFYLLTDGLSYCTATDLDKEPLDGRKIFHEYLGKDEVVRYGDGVGKVVVSGGRFTFDDDTSEVLLNQLPPLIRLPAISPSATSLKAILDLLAYETETIRPGYTIAATGIANLALIHILREQLAAMPMKTGWLCAIRDKQIGTVLSLMHGDIAKRWTVDDLASGIGMSRTAFTQRFKKLVGFSPLDYLLRWRMTVAGSALRNGVSLTKVADQVGYSSDTAFNSAFKRIIGQSPGRYRSNALANHFDSQGP